MNTEEGRGKTPEIYHLAEYKSIAPIKEELSIKEAAELIVGRVTDSLIPFLPLGSIILADAEFDVEENYHKEDCTHTW